MKAKNLFIIIYVFLVFMISIALKANREFAEATLNGIFWLQNEEELGMLVFLFLSVLG
jgi:hypothetical protein